MTVVLKRFYAYNILRFSSDPIEVDFSSSNIVTLVGPAGKGKTSVLKAIAILAQTVVEIPKQPRNSFANTSKFETCRAICAVQVVIDDQLTIVGIVTPSSTDLTDPTRFKCDEWQIAYFTGTPDVIHEEWGKILTYRYEIWQNFAFNFEEFSQKPEFKILEKFFSGFVILPQDHGLEEKYLLNTPCSVSITLPLSPNDLRMIGESPVAKDWLRQNCNLLIKAAGGNVLFANVESPDRSFSLNGASGGQKDAILCLLVAVVLQKKVVLLDEPGQNLGSFARRQLADLFRHGVHDRQIILVTHHVEMLHRHELPEGIRCIAMSSQRSQTVIKAKPLHFDDIAKEAAREPKNLDMYFAPGVIIVEGDDDRETLLALSELLHTSTECRNRVIPNVSNWGGLRWHVAAACGHTKIVNLENMCRAMGLPFVSIRDVDAVLEGGVVAGGSPAFLDGGRLSKLPSIFPSEINVKLLHKYPQYCRADLDGFKDFLSEFSTPLPHGALDISDVDVMCTFIMGLDEQIFSDASNPGRLSPRRKFLTCILPVAFFHIRYGPSSLGDYVEYETARASQNTTGILDNCVVARPWFQQNGMFVWLPAVCDNEGLYIDKRLGIGHDLQLDPEWNVYNQMFSAMVSTQEEMIRLPLRQFISKFKKKIEFLAFDKRKKRLEFCIATYPHIAAEVTALFAFLQKAEAF